MVSVSGWMAEFDMGILDWFPSSIYTLISTVTFLVTLTCVLISDEKGELSNLNKPSDNEMIVTQMI